MPDFSTIAQSPEIRAIVQEGLLERAFHDALYPRILFRGEAMPQLWPNNVGDSMVFTGVGLMAPKLQPLVPGSDPTPSTYQVEQWTATLQQYADTIDTHMPTSIVAIANLMLRNAQQLGLGSGQSMNRIVRDRLYNAALSGNTVANGAQAATTTLAVQRLNGFTRARRPDLPMGSPVQFTTVSTNNPLQIYTVTNGVYTQNTVVGYTSNNPGDEIGPGTLTLGTAATVNNRDPVISFDASQIVYVGGGHSVNDIGPTDLMTLAAIRTAVSYFWQENVPEMPDGRFHMHMDPTAQGQVFSDPEFQRLLTSLPDYFMYKQFALGELLGTVVFRNSECPLPETVYPKDGQTFSLNDPYAGEFYSNGNPTTGTPLHETLLVAQGAIYEYYQDLGALITEAGITGKVGSSSITNNGIEVNTDRVQLIIRSPLNRLQDLVSASWKFIGDWPLRTDVTTGGLARYKREVAITSGQ
jgi:hypothetical protein